MKKDWQKRNFTWFTFLFHTAYISRCFYKDSRQFLNHTAIINFDVRKYNRAFSQYCKYPYWEHLLTRNCKEDSRYSFFYIFISFVMLLERTKIMTVVEWDDLISNSFFNGDVEHDVFKEETSLLSFSQAGGERFCVLLLLTVCSVLFITVPDFFTAVCVEL